MDQFITVAKLWPSGADLDLGTDSNSLTVPASFNRHAANFVTSPDGSQNYQFLFWNTGRHVTRKRRVHWSFNVGGWGAWTATRWYGTPPGPDGSGKTRVRADAFNIRGDAPLSSASPIDGPASTFVAGAFPFGTDDHAIETTNGAATVVAKDPFNSYQFAGWVQLTWGGDDSGEFIETDAGLPSGGFGTPGTYEHVVGGAFSAAMETNADLLATYGNQLHSYPDWRRVIEEVIQERRPFEIPINWDPSPMDMVRLKLLEQYLKETQPNPAETLEFQRLIKLAPTMSQQELRRTLQSLKTTLDLGKSALAAIDAQLKKKG